MPSTVQRVPTFDEPFYSQVVTLDGSPYLLSFAWNDRTSTWFLDVATGEGEPIACGLKLVCSWDLLKNIVDERRPPGRLVVLALTPDDSPPGLEDLVAGGRCRLVYGPQP